MSSLVQSTPSSIIHSSNNQINSSQTQSKYVMAPCYITSAKVAVRISETTNALGINFLTPKIWADLGKEEQKNIIDNHRFVYAKVDINNKIIYEFGMHISICKKIEELKLEQIILDKKILNVDIQAVYDKSYSNMLKTFLPQLV